MLEEEYRENEGSGGEEDRLLIKADVAHNSPIFSSEMPRGTFKNQENLVFITHI